MNQSPFRSRYSRILTAGVAGLFAIAFISPALADAIDGQWCSPAGKQMKIDGPSLTTPARKTIKGNYSRHSFSYVVPAGEPNYGSTIYMTLLGEEDLDVRLGSPVAKPVRWKRCENIS